MRTTNRNRRYSNGVITVVWQPSECIHAGVCFTRLRRVFDPIKRPWVNMEGGTTEEIIAIVEACPTRALTFLWEDPERNESDPSPKIFKQEMEALFPETGGNQPVARITVYRGGPLTIEGNYTVLDPDNRPIQTPRMASICRCGLSNDQPFCDGTHFRARFRS